MPKYKVSVECHTPGRDEIHWLKLDADNEGDADANSCVLSFNLNPGDQRVTNWLWNIVAAFPENFPIWMPIPELPKGVKRENRPR